MAYCSVYKNDYDSMVFQGMNTAIRNYLISIGMNEGSPTFAGDVLIAMEKFKGPVESLYSEYCKEPERVLYLAHERTPVYAENEKLKPLYEPIADKKKQNIYIYSGIFLFSAITGYVFFKMKRL